MKEGLRYLFSGPSAAEGLVQAPPVTVGAAEQSPFFHAFLRDVASSGSVLSTGYSRLDRLLAGGFRPGVYLLSGHRGRMRRLFLDNLMWGAVGEGTPVSYLAIQTGAQSAWERMIVTLGRLVGEPLTIGDLRVFPHPGQLVERVGRLDAALVRSVLPQVALEDSILTDPALPSSFLAALDARLAGDTSPRLVLVDSLPRLLALLQVDGLQASSAFAWELDRLLYKRSSVGVAASGQEPDPELRDVVQGLLRLDPVDDGSGTEPERLLVSVHERSRGVESTQFVADEASGLLA
ncbi:MAG: hypothetical protein M5U22_20505 [Thermoleophilia bacterium]|nr:hypothetical protein [Thermoleophilia bacterium]